MKNLQLFCLLLKSKRSAFSAQAKTQPLCLIKKKQETVLDDLRQELRRVFVPEHSFTN